MSGLVQTSWIVNIKFGQCRSTVTSLIAMKFHLRLVSSFGHQHLSCLTTGTHYSELNAAYKCHMVCWSRGLASLEIVETFSHLLNYWDKYRFLFNRPFPFRRWPDCLRYLVPQSCLIHTGLEDTKTRSNFISHQGNSHLKLIIFGAAWNNKNAPDGIPRPWLV